MNTMRFPPGKSGNPAGRPPGAQHKTTKMAQALFDEIGQVIVENGKHTGSRPGRVIREFGRS